ncbi:MFS general substrate transporter [Aspergillus granulosus]|uniref:MFS general substrate transporter n=1 Tax=Aspergillus granulosus TaxID=176169 RepID=A0ABR4H5L8_9EURO
MSHSKSASEVVGSDPSDFDVREASSPQDVFWDGDSDPGNPKNWSSMRRWFHVVAVSLLTFVTSLGSSMLAPAVPDIMDSLNTDNAELESFVVSIYIIGFVVGPLVVAPFSELYGRAIVYNITNVVFLGAAIGSALSTNMGMFLAFRLISGCAGVTPLSLGGGTISDLMKPERMGTAMAIWGLGSLITPVFAPIAGGYLAEAAGWRWIFWVMVIPMGILTVLFPFITQETYAPVLLERKAKRLQKETGNPSLKSRLRPQISQRRFIVETLVRPLRLLLTSPIVTLLAIDVAVVYGYQYLVFSTLSYIFQDQYHMSTGVSGLIYLGNGMGAVLGVLTIGYASDKVTERRKMTLSNSSGLPASSSPELKPEGWLWPMIPSGILVPVGLFWYGWSLEHHTHPVIPLVGLGVFAFGMMGIIQPVQIYIVNAFGKHAASALAGVTVLRSLVGALLPLGAQRMYDVLGMGWGNSLLAFIAVALIPVPALLMKFGAKLRREA